jgi:hypothetical protein
MEDPYVLFGIGPMPSTDTIFRGIDTVWMVHMKSGSHQSLVSTLKGLLCLSMTRAQARRFTGESRKSQFKKYSYLYGNPKGFYLKQRIRAEHRVQRHFYKHNKEGSTKVLSKIFTVISADPAMFAKMFLAK